MFAFIREDDETDHGGRVLKCTTKYIMNGRPMALFGDLVACPRCGGVFPIVSVKRELNMTFDGRPVATAGDKTACGATLIASQNLHTASPTTGSGGPIGGGRSVASQLIDPTEDCPHRGRFQLRDDVSGNPIPNHPYVVTARSGESVAGQTDENGYTDWLETGGFASLKFERSGANSA